MTVEEMIYELGQMQSGQKKNKDREKDLCRGLEDCEVLVEDDGMGNGWRVVDDGGMPAIPSRVKHYVWRSKGYAWAFWMGMGMPHGYSMIAKSDPRMETDAINSGKPVDFSEVELSIDNGPRLRVVK